MYFCLSLESYIFTHEYLTDVEDLDECVYCSILRYIVAVNQYILMSNRYSLASQQEL